MPAPSCWTAVRSCWGARDAALLGIHLVHQELALLPQASVVENVFLGAELAGRAGLLDWGAMRQRAAQVLDGLGAAVRPGDRVSSLAVAQQQLVEIARALVGDARVIILDEPTAALAPEESDALFGVLRRLRAEGRAIVYISHRLTEVLALADRVTVLKDGQLVGTWPAGELTAGALVQRMVGRPVEDLYPGPGVALTTGAPALDVRGLVDPPLVRGVDLRVWPGEIVGLAGLEGQGQDEVLACLAGDRRPAGGAMAILGAAVAWGGVRHMTDRGIGYVPEDRKTRGLLLEQSAIRNIALPSLPRLSRWGVVRRGLETALGRRMAERIGVRGSIEAPVRTLSGGNQQKVVLAKWLARERRVLLLDQPTRGVDVGAKAEIYALLREFAAAGGAVLLSSRELPEVLGLCDRVLVVHQGRVVRELPRGATEEVVMAAAALGAHAEGAAA
ncbi:MAG: sugar ABC transporter ATP-binding protein [Chloroflexota bacterium]